MLLRIIKRNISATSKMATQCSPFTKAVIQAIRKIYPEKLADSSFDNTGLLLEAPHRQQNNLKNSVLLTGDLTQGVADEAIRRKDSVIIAYHPIIFRGLKALTLGNSQQNSLLRLAQEGISVYSPHTAVDAAPGGLNDWLADIVAGEATSSRSVINAVAAVSDTKGFEGAGYGRILRFEEPQLLGEVVERIRKGLGGLRGLSVAVPQEVPVGKRSEVKISSVGICAGSGGSMLNGLEVDLLFTGELSHHEALAAIEVGTCVVTAFHSNTERQFLSDVMAGKLRSQIADEMGSVEGLNASDDFEVVVSEVDRDPYDIVVAGQSRW